MTGPAQGTRVAVDVGGTFTDVVSLDPIAGILRVDKVETVPADPAAGVLHALAKIGAPPAAVAYFVHGTTLALNALLTRTGAKVAIVTTAGFKDVFVLGRTDREPMYDLTYRKPAPLVPRSLAFEVQERMTWDGTPLRPVDAASVREVAARLRASGVGSVAVSLLHSYANPSHELAVGAILRAELPGVDVTLSHQLLREYREYERTSTAVLDAYVKPVVRAYLTRLEGELAGQGFTGRFLMTRSGGGTMTVDAAKERPVNLVLSGPAGGVVGAAAFADLIGERNVITLDMGGTSLDASIIIDGEPVLTRDARFEGLPVSLPALDINTIGAGGGSIAWMDDGNHLQVGPKSAGADPGPAAYGRGGTRATVTDAALVLGYLGTDTALGGELRLDRDLARSALEPLAAAMDLSPEAVAAGILRITTTRITGAVREITVERGHVPGDFAIFSFGGGGGLIAADVARELGVPRVVVPPGPGAFCALGMLFADVVHDAARTWVLALKGVDTGALDAAYGQLEASVTAGLETDGFSAADRGLTRSADLRYQGQEHTVNIALPAGRMDADAVAALTEAFGVAHLTLYGHRTNDPIELVTLRVRGTGRVPRPELPRLSPPSGEAPDGIVGARRVQGAGAAHDYEVVQRAALTAGSVVVGPAIVEEHTATTVLHPGDVGRVGTHGELDITIAPGSRSMGEPTTTVDSITVEVIRHRLLSASQEMMRNLQRTAHSTIVYEIRDFGLGIYDAKGALLAEAPGLAIFTRANDYSLEKAIEFLGVENIDPGDCILLNYPYWSSAHTLDVAAFSPIHHEGELLGFTATRIHWLDLKQKDAGYVLDSTDMHQEGIFFPCTKIERRGVIQQDIVNLITFNSRYPEQTVGDMRAQIAACRTGERRVNEIVERFGVDVFKAACTRIQDHGERLARAGLKKLPKGTWTAHDFVDDDGIDERLVRMECTVTISDDEMLVDWSASDPQVKGPINLPYGMTLALSSLIFKALTTPDTPATAGNFRPLRVIAPEGNLMHASPPAPTFTLWTGLLAGEVITKALAQGMPDLVPACSGGDVCSMMGLGLDPRTGRHWLEATNEAVGFGGHVGGDGESGIMHLSEPGCRNNPVEVLEVKSPMLIEHYGLRPDSGGPGEHRGGLGVSRVYRFTAPSTAITLVKKTRTRPWGMEGGETGDNCHVILRPGTDAEKVTGGVYESMGADEVLVNNSGGGGGWGDPFRRSVTAVLEDVREGYVTPDRARIDYGVVVDVAAMAVDESATAAIRASRGAQA